MADEQPQQQQQAHLHTQSIAYLNQAKRVSGYAMPSSQHVTKNPSDLQQVADAALVTTNKDNYDPDEEDELALQSGPRKKYIDQQQQQQQEQQAQATAVPLSNFAHQNLHSGNNVNAASDAVDAFVPSANDAEQQNYESFFADDDNNNNNNNQTQNGNDNANDYDNDDMFGGMDQAQDDNDNFNANANATTYGDAMEDALGDAEQKQEAKQTFLSVWQEEHREQLAKKAKEEREAQEKLVQTGKKALEEFNEQRRLRIEQQRKDAQSREADLKEDYNAVFKHGTIWQQVAKLVDLKEKNKKTERMRDLLIVLKNDDEKSEQ